MQIISYRASALALVLALTCGSAHAHVLDKKEDAAAFKLRATVAKQLSGYRACLSKAVVKCEAKGASSAPECDPTTGAVAYEPGAGKQTEKFQAALAKCDAKLDPDKKSTDYVGIGCPGDCSSAPGTQACASLAAYESDLESTSGVKAYVLALQTEADVACAGEGAPDGEARIDCVGDALKALTTFRQKIDKCAQSCEADVKGSKGGGALTNDAVCVAPGGHASVVACIGKAGDKLSGAAATLSIGIVNDANEETADLYNRENADDPASPAGTLSPCGTCGDAVREGTEECDGMGALGDCEACAADCTCTSAVCGNGIIEGAEECDGATLGTCTTSCAGDCTCLPPPVCGNGVIEGTEVCDGATLGTCASACAGDCLACEPVCGDGAIEGTEECDGAALGICGACASDCTCDLGDPILDGPAGTFCSSDFNATTTDYQEICAPSAGSGHHFRIEGAQTFGNNGFFYLAMGFPPSTTGNPATVAGDGKFIFTGGKSVSCGFGWSYFRYSGITSPAANPCSAPEIFGDYGLGPQEVCLDVSSHNPPVVTFWATGKNGADCKNRTTLTAATALYSKNDWASADNQPVNDVIHYMKVNSTSLATLSRVLVSSNTVIDYDDPILGGPAGTFCETEIDPATANYQPLCAPTAGSGRHFRMEDIYLGANNNGFVYLAMGFPTGLETSATNPTTPADGDGRFLFTAGKSVSCTFSWNYFRYTGITSPAANPCSVPVIFDGFRDTGANPGPGTVCMDVTGANPARVTFWASGANGADCKDKSTLTALTALYTKDDWSSANIQPISATTHYAKINNTALATMSSVAVSSNTVLP